MKKYLIIALLSLCARAYAQEGLKLHIGALGAITSTTDFKDKKQPFKGSVNFSPNILLVTPYTFHNVMYGTFTNTIQAVNGYFLNRKKDIDAYVVARKNLALPAMYAGIGIETMVKGGDIPFFLFAEGGISFKPGQRTFTVGFHANIEKLHIAL